jgi:serine/threonine protein kinase
MESGRVPEPSRPVTGTPARPKVERFGRYHLIECIGRGGMAEVFRAVTQGVEGFRRTFVVKRILAEKASSPTFIRMFTEEARISALLHHPNIVQVYDFGQVGTSYFLAMEYLQGKDLASVRRVLRASNLAVPPNLAAFIAHEVAVALDYAHALRTSSGQPLGIVHRDVTPSNIMLLVTGGVKVLDFGIAKAASAVHAHSSGRVKGKFGYLSPEQARTEEVDGRSDLFALGITLWEMLTGRRLFAGANELETLRNVLQKPIPAPSTVRPGIPADLDRVALRALERDVGRRYQDAAEMAADLELVLRDTHTESQSLRRLLAELFGEESSSLSADIPELPEDLAPPPQPASSGPSLQIEVVEEQAPPITRARTLAPPFGVATTSSPALPELRPRRPRALVAAVAAVVALAAVGGLYALVRRSGQPPPPALAVASATAARPAPGAAAPAPTPPAPSVEPLPAKIRLELDSSPRGADVRGSGGELLGVTPLALEVPRGQERRAFTIAKDGYRNASYELVPDRDSSAFIELPRLRAPAHASSSHHRHGTRARDLGDGLTLDPF